MTQRQLNRKISSELNVCASGVGFDGAALLMSIDEDYDCMYQIVAGGDTFECEGGDAEEVAMLIAKGFGFINEGAGSAFRQGVEAFRARVRDMLAMLTGSAPTGITPLCEIYLGEAEA